MLTIPSLFDDLDDASRMDSMQALNHKEEYAFSLKEELNPIQSQGDGDLLVVESDQDKSDRLIREDCSFAEESHNRAIELLMGIPEFSQPLGEGGEISQMYNDYRGKVGQFMESAGELLDDYYQRIVCLKQKLLKAHSRKKELYEALDASNNQQTILRQKLSSLISKLSEISNLNDVNLLLENFKTSNELALHKEASSQTPPKGKITVRPSWRWRRMPVKSRTNISPTPGASTLLLLLKFMAIVSIFLLGFSHSLAVLQNNSRIFHSLSYGSDLIDSYEAPATTHPI